jgi:hypothetical protein
MLGEQLARRGNDRGAGLVGVLLATRPIGWYVHGDILVSQAHLGLSGQNSDR